MKRSTAMDSSSSPTPEHRPRIRLVRAGDIAAVIDWIAEGLAGGLTKRQAVKLALGQLEVRVVRRFERITEGGR